MQAKMMVLHLSILKLIIASSSKGNVYLRIAIKVTRQAFGINKVINIFTFFHLKVL